MGVHPSCFIIGISLLKISHASELAAWAAKKDRVPEVGSFLASATTFISQAEAAGLITAAEAEKMKNSIWEYNEAEERGDSEAAQDALSGLSGMVTDIVFSKVAECELRHR